jgi:proteasome lid subunit RPN8/RPN11
MAASYLLPPREKRRLHDRAFRAQQRDHSEVCGALVVDDDKHCELWFFTNLSNRPRRFDFLASNLRAAKSQARANGKRVIGVFHSHPVGYAKPSKSDLHVVPVGGYQLIYDVCAREVALWRIAKVGHRRVAHRVVLHIGRARTPSNIAVERDARKSGARPSP